MERNTDTWILLYQDSLAQLWGRRTKYADPQSPDFIAPGARIVSNQQQEGIVNWPAMPVRVHSQNRVVTRDKHSKGDSES
jgi:hypothetical protein